MATPIIDQFDEDKTLLIYRIKDLEFVDDASEFKCKRCENVLINHYISNCGHAFCANCKKLLGDGSGEWKCPECQENVTEIDFQDVELEQKLFNLRVYCANTNYGCSFSCLLKDLAQHLIVCEHTRENALPVERDNGNTIEAIFEQIVEFNKKFGKLNLDIELINQKLNKMENKQETFDSKLEEINTRINSVNLDANGATIKIDNELDELKNNRIPEDLINKMDKLEADYLNLSRNSNLLWEALDLESEQECETGHSTKFQFSFRNNVRKAESESKNDTENNVTCRLKNVEDKIATSEKELVIQLKDMENKLEPHLFQVENDIKMLKTHLKPVLLKNIYLKRLPDFIWEIPNVKNKLKQDSLPIVSQWVRLHEYPFKAQINIKRESEEVDLTIWLQEFFEEGTEFVPPPLLPTLHLVVREQTDLRYWDIIRTANKRFDSSPINTPFRVYNFNKIVKSKLANYIKNNTLMLELYAEPSFVTNHVSSYNGTLTWAIENYTKWKQLEREKCVEQHESPYFYTGPKGYRVQANFMLNYLNESVAVNIKFLNGEFDQQLQAKISFKVTVTILNRKNSDGHIIIKKSVVEGVETSLSWITMGSHKEIESVMVYDTLHYHVQIEAV